MSKDDMDTLRAQLEGEAVERHIVRALLADHQTLLTACETALKACQANIAMWMYKDELALLAAINELRPAIANAKGVA